MEKDLKFGASAKTVTEALHGRTIAEVWANGNEMVFRCTDGLEVTVDWTNEDGVKVPGRPRVRRAEWRIYAKTAHIMALGAGRK
jgi:hypothetical protein